MPFIRVTTNATITKDSHKKLIEEFGNSISVISGKTEKWLMLEFKDHATMAFSGSTAPCAMVEADLFGAADKAEKGVLTSEICKIVESIVGVPQDRIYVRYLETDTWGFDGDNF